jgi:glutaredoxin
VLIPNLSISEVVKRYQLNGCPYKRKVKNLESNSGEEYLEFLNEDIKKVFSMLHNF